MAVSLTITVILVEVGLRLAGFSYFNPYIADPELGFALRPNAEGWWTKEGSAYVKINSRGLRDYEHTLEKPENTIRIAVLGDSFAEALQVPIEDTFWSIMRRQLQSAMSTRGKHVEVLNFGVSGFSTARELIMLRQRVWQYSPDLVVLLVTPENDIRDNSQVLTVYSEALPYFVYRNGSLELDDSLLKLRSAQYAFKLQQSFAGRALNWIRHRSRIVGLFYTARESYLSHRRQLSSYNASIGERGVDDHIFLAPTTSDWADAWRLTEKLILQMRDEVQAKDAKFLLVTGSNGIQVEPDATERTKYMRQLGVTTLFYPDLRIKEFAEREKIDVLNLAPRFLEFATHTQTVLHGSGATKGRGHWNKEGHKLAGKLIADSLLERL